MNTWSYYAVITGDDDNHTVECVGRYRGDLAKVRDYYRDEANEQDARIVECNLPLSLDDIDVIVDE